MSKAFRVIASHGNPAHRHGGVYMDSMIHGSLYLYNYVYVFSNIYINININNI